MFFINMIYIKANLKYLKSSSSYLTNLELNWTNQKLNVYYKEEEAMASLLAWKEWMWSVRCSESEDLGSNINCSSKSQSLWASCLLIWTSGGGGDLWVSSSWKYLKYCETIEITYTAQMPINEWVKKSCGTYTKWNIAWL